MYRTLSQWAEDKGATLFPSEPETADHSWEFRSVVALFSGPGMYPLFREWEGIHTQEAFLPGSLTGERVTACTRVSVASVANLPPYPPPEDWKIDVYRNRGACCHGPRSWVRITHIPTQMSLSGTHRPSSSGVEKRKMLRMLQALIKAQEEQATSRHRRFFHKDGGWLTCEDEGPLEITSANWDFLHTWLLEKRLHRWVGGDKQPHSLTVEWASALVRALAPAQG
ncbi:MAG: hypothetical protein EP343_18820 [Deltaproteobacteria bacterium]|nr:MAG: hypothetical protein EP343_18820 [Deltaproteobacteria bacterium]